MMPSTQENAMIFCDLCNEAKDCTPRQIEGKEYDICSACWKQLSEKLAGKGRAKKEPDFVFLPPSTEKPEPKGPEPAPRGDPPIIWGRENRTQ
jgi:hypothetical protein